MSALVSSVGSVGSPAEPELAKQLVHQRHLATLSSRLTPTNRIEWQALRSEGSVREVDNPPGGSELAPGCFVTTPEPGLGSPSFGMMSAEPGL